MTSDPLSTRAARLLEKVAVGQSLQSGLPWEFVREAPQLIHDLLSELTAAEAERDNAVREEKHYHALYVKRLQDYQQAESALTAAREALRQLVMFHNATARNGCR